jgi:glucose/arabinose dehydrogenase
MRLVRFTLTSALRRYVREETWGMRPARVDFDLVVRVVIVVFALIGPGRSLPAAAPGEAQGPIAIPRLATRVAYPYLKFDRPIALAYPPDDSKRLFIAEQRGVIHGIPEIAATTDRRVFLDISARVFSPDRGGHNEEGLLGLAFHPDYRWNREFFVFYTAREGATGRRPIIARYRASEDDPRRALPASEERIWIGPPDPFGNHNGGCLAFGPDGYLYFSLGDGGAADDPLKTGQNPSDWYGSILRIDVNRPAEGHPYGIPGDNPRLRDPSKFADWAPEVFCIGLRNVWKFSFDRVTGQLWAGDVGQNKWEMVHIIANGGNYGWSVYEGKAPFRLRQQVDSAAPISQPLAVHPHSPNQEGCGRRDDGKSITGGYVYRGQVLPELLGAYVYGDFETGRIWGLWESSGRVLANGELIAADPRSRLNIAAFAENRDGELYILAFDGRIYRLIRRS